MRRIEVAFFGAGDRPAIGFPLGQYRPRCYQQASMVTRVVRARDDPAYVIRTLYDIQMAADPAAYTRVIDIMRTMSRTLVERFRGLVYRPLRTLDPGARRAGSVLGLVGSRLPADVLEEQARTAYFAAVLPDSPAEIMQPPLAVSGHPRVWAAEFLAAASRHDAVTIRDTLLIPYLLPENEDLTKFRFLTLGMAEFACIWSALWMAERSATPEDLACILSKVDLRCPSYQKQLSWRTSRRRMCGRTASAARAAARRSRPSRGQSRRSREVVPGAEAGPKPGRGNYPLPNPFWSH